VGAAVLAAYPYGLYLDVAGVVLPLVTSDAVPLPTALLLTEPARHVDWGVEPGGTVTVGEGRVRLPGLDVVVARMWRAARVRPASTAPSSPPVPVARVRGGTRRPTPYGGITQALAGEDRRWLAAGIRCAVHSPDPDPHVRGLLGRGSGLTPSGDDALAGALLVCHALGVGAALGAAVRRRLGATTAVSAALLSAAADGYAARDVVLLVDAALAGDPPGVRAALPTVLSIGHGSGRDLVTGVSAAVEGLGCAPARSCLLAALALIDHRAPAPVDLGPTPSFPTLTGRSAA
jgi:hypothetical protein